jgi:hypothetical protein
MSSTFLLVCLLLVLRLRCCCCRSHVLPLLRGVLPRLCYLPHDSVLEGDHKQQRTQDMGCTCEHQCSTG